MRERTFIGRRQGRWDRLEALLSRAGRSGVQRLPPDDLEDLALLYRAATTDLAAAQTRDYGAGLQAYLNRLVARAHAAVYAERTDDGARRVARFFTTAFPRELRASAAPILTCAALFVLAAIFSWWLVQDRPINVYTLLPASEVPLVHKSLHDSNFGFDRAYSAAMSAAIITNNIRVAAVAFAGGMTLGIVTVWAVIGNGVMLGALGALFARHGFGTDFFATIAPHGVLELTAIQIAGGAGLLIASGIVAPGRMRRVDALRARARRAATLIIGVAAMLVVAGTIEGFFTPQRTTIALRFGVGAVTAAAFAAYVAFAGRERTTSDRAL